jgi:hypothetical protein
MSMNESAITKNAIKNAITDIVIIVAVTALSMGIYLTFYDQITMFVKDTSTPVLLRLLSIAFLQYSGAGLGITIVCIWRREPFTSYGLNRKNILTAILLSCLMYIPHLVLTFTSHNWHGYFPFQSVWTTNEILTSGLPTIIAGMVITATAWGFFEGFNYVVIRDKINICLPTKYWWLDWGAIICAVMCILIHGMVGITPDDILEMLSVFIIIYGSLVVRKKTGNSWGLVFTFIFLWNAY